MRRLTGLSKKLDVINSEIQQCSRCKLSQLQFNVKNKKLGYGKLYGWSGNRDASSILFMFVGMNPSHRRFPNIEYAFGGSTFAKGTGVEFVKMLGDLNLKEKSFIDNLCHCSSINNRVNYINAQKCFKHLLREIKVFKNLRRVIALGNFVYDTLTELFEENNVDIPVSKIWHPNFVISYRRDLLSLYIDEIKSACF